MMQGKRHPLCRTMAGEAVRPIQQHQGSHMRPELLGDNAFHLVGFCIRQPGVIAELSIDDPDCRRVGPASDGP